MPADCTVGSLSSNRFSGADTLSTYSSFFTISICLTDSHGLQIRHPAAFCPVVCVTYPISICRSFSANLAFR